MIASRRLALILFCALALFGATPLRPHAAQERPQSFSFTILHTNDLHGHILPFAYVEVGRDKTEKASVGGAARRATLIRRLKQAIRNPNILVDAGDTFTRGPLTNAYEGGADIAAMNALGYELAAIGNNEFKAKDGYEVNDAQGSKSALLKVIRHSRFHWLCANATDEKGAALEGVSPYVIREYQGVKIGFLGLTAPRSASYPQTKGWSITDPIAVAKAIIPRIRAQCDLLIAITHIGYDLDKRLAAQTSGIDAIVGGDSHTFLYQAAEVANLEGKKVPIVQDGEFGVNLGRFDLRFMRGTDGKWALSGFDYRLIPVSADIPEASDVNAALAPYLRPMKQVVGQLEKVGASPEERNRLTNQIILDAMRQEANADFALAPSDALYDTFRSIKVSRYDVFAALPFKNRVVVARLTSEEMEGLRQKIKTTLVHPQARLERGKTYRVAFADYAALSEYGLPAERLEETGKDLRDVVIGYLGQRRK